MPDETKKKKDDPKPEDPKLADAQPATFATGMAATTDNDECTPVCVEKWPEAPLPLEHRGTLDVNLKGASVSRTRSISLSEVIREAADGTAFGKYNDYINRVLCLKTPDPSNNLFVGVDAYQLLKVSTEAFLLKEARFLTALQTRTEAQLTDVEKEFRTYLGGALSTPLPFIERIIAGFKGSGTNPFCTGGNITEDVREPAFLELIWSYWLEEGMLVQAINAISLRFQNKRGPGDRDPLANMEMHYLRPLSNLLWGYIQDEHHRLTVARRAYEYEHEYGLPLVGKAVPHLRPADRRSKFLEAFHSLLHQAAVFYDRRSNLTVRADGFPLLNALREVHLILAEGAHNQFRDLPWTARVEMLMQQWLLSRPEIHNFLGGRQAVPYAEPWMGPVDTLRRLLGWGDTPVSNFRDLAVNGEKILLSIRFGDWSDINDEEEARAWAELWKPEVQRYMHAYQSVTGVDLASMSADRQMAREINAVPPSILLQQRLARQKTR
ncbi:MAG TPA: hypothetical protein VND45_00305 [Thermoanaerobaculia bacterium]|jgi:hypothetical protein|nr:hypothetical protein [Thermoanaerobaculia bacterium]